MAQDDDDSAREFHVVTNFQRMARRPGGVTREQAVQKATAAIETFKPGFKDWLDRELDELLQVVPGPEGISEKELSWIDVADMHCQRLADVAATMDYQFVSFVAANLCVIFEAMKKGAEYHPEVIACHVDALQLASREQYRRLRAEDLPELTEGLRRVLDSPRLQPRLNDGH